jgi:hypothetical protein
MSGSLQEDLFGQPERTKPEFLPFQVHARPSTPEFVHHSELSADAAFAMKDKAPSIRERVYELLKSEALTDQQIAQRLELDPNTARPRRIELTNAHRIVEVGRALTDSGRHASVWKAA